MKKAKKIIEAFVPGNPQEAVDRELMSDPSLFLRL